MNSKEYTQTFRMCVCLDTEGAINFSNEIIHESYYYIEKKLPKAIYSSSIIVIVVLWEQQQQQQQLALLVSNQFLF